MQKQVTVGRKQGIFSRTTEIAVVLLRNTSPPLLSVRTKIVLNVKRHVNHRSLNLKIKSGVSIVKKVGIRPMSQASTEDFRH